MVCFPPAAAVDIPRRLGYNVTVQVICLCRDSDEGERHENYGPTLLLRNPRKPGICSLACFVVK